MSRTYDTSEMRQAASIVREVTESVSSESKRTLSWILQDIPDNLAGDAAEALKTKVSDFCEEIRRIDENLEKTATKLELFAANLDEADRKASEMIQYK